MIEFRVGQLAGILGVHRNTVTNWIRSGRLAARPTVGKKYLIEIPEFQRFCRDQGISEGVADRLSPAGSHAVVKPRKRQPIKREVTMSQKAIGSVMVVGGGIAGIQATLDLADSGYYVYLVEKSSGIGGAMAQLDKTFPTNDCAM